MLRVACNSLERMMVEAIAVIEKIIAHVHCDRAKDVRSQWTGGMSRERH